MRGHHVDCPLCGSRVDLGSAGPERDTLALCPKCLQAFIVEPVIGGYEARCPGGNVLVGGAASAFEMQFPGQRAAVTVPLRAGTAGFASYLDVSATGTSENSWTVVHPVRKIARVLLQSISGGVRAVAGLINAWRQAMADHPVKTMVISFVVAAVIIAMLMSMWLIYLAVIRGHPVSLPF